MGLGSCTIITWNQGWCWGLSRRFTIPRLLPYCPRWQHQLQPPFLHSKQWERGGIKKGLSLHVGSTSGQLHMFQWPKAGQLATLGHEEWWKTHLFQTALSPVTIRVSVLKKKVVGQRQEGRSNLFHRDTCIYQTSDSTHFINWTTLG